jgi:NitT/TauT family transport system permease protein
MVEVAGRRRSHRRRRMIVWTGRIAVVLVIAAVWELLGRLGAIDPVLVGEPWGMLKAFVNQLGQSVTYSALAITLEETLLGWVLASLAGIVTGLALSQSELARDIFDPFITGLNSLPRIALAPLFILWFGLGILSKVALAFSLVYFVMLLATLGSVANVDSELVRLARVLGFSRWQIYLKVVIPWSVSGIFGGLQLGLVTAFLGAVTGEILGAQSGMGVVLTEYANLFKTNDVMAALLILAIVASALSMAMRVLEKHLVRHRARADVKSR